ncbi:hypothetical protein GF339_12105 [candidate division KSB3 bacterium]|uniref:DUF5942 domain-containing protein n=1 Tax=candidate division KSB3 bacterium TaxID=2044937 RepID=A0A9D5JWB7_9BACT|nr:hypothetical protein [candidate division KSB3 bacterium]MBD3325323.1 hypothetical protein [candidate division KSB3 bacterium]
MALSSYFWNGLQHAVFGGCLALLFQKISHAPYVKKPEFLVGLIASSSALFFLPTHIAHPRSPLDWFYQFLHYPLSDWDILLLSLDWHRFFLTHSLLIPAILLIMLLHKPSGYRLGMGVAVGLSSHLIWDALTCSLRTPVVFITHWLEIRGYWGKGWLLINGMLLFWFAWFLHRKTHESSTALHKTT